jgi:hypothetical protein
MTKKKKANTCTNIKKKKTWELATKERLKNKGDGIKIPAN